MADGTDRIAEITLDERTVLRRSAEVEHERAAAITDLLHDNRFALAAGRTGPFRLHLAVEETRLLIEIRSLADGESETITLPLAPFRRVVKDYFLVCESYSKAIRAGNFGQVEAIDMGRRGLHNEGAELLTECLAVRAEIDHNTARRLFTLICVLHLKASARGLGEHPRS
ncbi:MAG TPA: UPF0262 family protein [Stellaceae bacterium]|nr:UPF0262 family protein [Stellaceae bacterium]